MWVEQGTEAVDEGDCVIKRRMHLPLFLSRSRSIQLPAKGKSRCSSSSRRISLQVLVSAFF